MDNEEGATLTLEGKLSGPWVDEVQKCWTGYVTRVSRVPIQVNLREVSYVDGRGRALLIRMEREGAALIEASDFIRHLLRENIADEGHFSTTPRKL
jgi:ABC-type transporter Mla MlaB component